MPKEEFIEHQVLNLNRLPLEEVTAHGGEKKILFNRAFDAEDFKGPWNFADYAVLPPGASIGIHTHGANEELYLVLEGQGIMHLDGREFLVKPGTLVLNKPGGTHGLRNEGPHDLKIFVVEIKL